MLTTAAAGGVSGTFSGLTIASGSFGNFVPYLTYPNGKSVQLDLTAGTLWSGTASSNWNTGGVGGNWSGGAVPTASSSTPADTVATFGSATNTNVTINTGATASALLFTSAATQAYNFTINGGNSLTLSGIGIDNNSGFAPTFTVGGTGSGVLAFQNAATAGNAIITTNSGGRTTFSGNSSGGTAQFNLATGGVLDFSGSLGLGNNGINTAASINNISGTGGSIYLGNTALVLSSGGTFGGVISDCGAGGQCSGNANGSHRRRAGGDRRQRSRSAAPTPTPAAQH